MKIAITGTPRGGTSVVAGLVRILGWTLPEGNRYCDISETSQYRWADNPELTSLECLSDDIGSLPDGVVWKDPAVAVYADLVRWEDWSVIKVKRDTFEVALSEKKWGKHPESIPVLEARARYWFHRIDQAVPKPVLELHLNDVRKKPEDALLALTHALDLPDPTGSQRYLALKYVLTQGGYRCPLPATCTIPH